MTQGQDGQGLYRRVLGEQFDALPEVLRRFHTIPGGGAAGGTLRVQRGRGWLRNALASLLGLPRAGTEVPVQLRVQVDGDRERWVRSFRGQPVVSLQWARDGLLMERAGLFSFSCRLVVAGPRLVFDFQRAWVAGVPLPRLFAPFVESYLDAEENGWWLLVRIFAPVLGEIVSYEGWIEPA